MELDSRSNASQHGGMTDWIARLHIALADTDPLIWRRVEVPVDAKRRAAGKASQVRKSR